LDDLITGLTTSEKPTSQYKDHLKNDKFNSMSNKQKETTSFVIRFTQKLYQDDQDETQIQWRGNIRHVQGGEEKRFSDFSKAMEFIQTKLADLTLESLEDKPAEEQKGILSKSFDLWKKVALDAPKLVIQTIKDPMAQVEQIQNQVKDVIDQNIEPEINQWRSASKTDFQELMAAVNNIAVEVKDLKKKVDKLSDKKKK